MKIKDFIDYEQPTDYIVESDRYSDEYRTPVLTAGQSFILGYTNEKEGIYNKCPCIIFDDFTTSVHYVDFPFKVKSSAMKILTSKHNANLKYCYYLLLSLSKMPPNHKRQWISTTSEKKHFLPSIDNQVSIVKQLDLVSDIISHYTMQINYLDNLIKARFVEMFGNPFENPYELPEATLPDLGEFGRGVSKHRPRNDPKLLGGDYPLIQTGDVANADLYISSYNATYSDLGLEQSKMWDKGTLCITIAANIAKTAILEFDACFPDSVVGFVANDKTSNIFIHYWFSFFQGILESQAPESAQKNINLKILSELKVIVPPIELQNEFVFFVKQIDKSKLAVQKSLEKTQQLFDSLMQEYFG
ncbi:restriction endonuclease subunit S [Faecalitalea cylindroides]|uniref:restriction endonuclease subunit S n=1 Tax=Faecalitalea cylindroides TaxID=39483 RepID=UPI00232BFCF0|nr:restriction endonuclease subunit S [Faecalitalea cylindroides]MDB7969657.1 restriction endonuclease subunit S [Faecalitalea cylindroides]